MTDNHFGSKRILSRSKYEIPFCCFW